MIPPKANHHFVYHMEDVLDLYHQPYDPSNPVVCFDETNKQLTAHARQPLLLPLVGWPVTTMNMSAAVYAICSSSSSLYEVGATSKSPNDAQPRTGLCA